MGILPFEKNTVRFAEIVNNALSVSSGAIDGDVLNLTGYSAFRDGGEQPLKYDAAATDTIDGGFVFPGKGGSLAFTGTTFSGTAGTGRWKAVSRTEADCRKFGAVGDGVADDSSPIQRAITACLPKSAVIVPQGNYLCKDITIPNTKVMAVRGSGARLLAASGAAHILHAGADTTRDLPLEISGLHLDGNDLSNVIGLHIPIRTNVLLSDCSIKRCHYGLNMQGYNIALNSCAFQGNVIGTRIFQDASSGGGNGCTYTNVEWHGNTVGFLMDGTATSALPCQNSVFLGCVIQNNLLCGAAFFQTSNSVFIATHFEANFTEGSTLAVDGVTVRGANIHLHSSTLKVIHLSPAYTSPCVVMESESSLEIDGAEFYGTTTGPLIRDLDGDSAVYMHGRISTGTQARCKLRSLPDFLQVYVRFAFSAEPLVKVDHSVENLMLTPNAPALVNPIGAAVNANVVDEEQGVVSSVTFAASAGTTASNRVQISTGMGTVTTGDKAIVSLLCKTDKDTELVFEITDGNYGRFDYLSTDRQWRRIVMMIDAGSTAGPAVYIYPADSAGANVRIAKMMVHRVADGESDDAIQRIMKEGLFNPNTNLVTEGSDADLTLDANSGTSLIYPTNVAGFRRVNLPTPAVENDALEISRVDAGDGTLYLHGAGLLLSKQQWARLRHDGTIWRPMQSGGVGSIVTAPAYIAGDSDLINRWNGDANLDTTGDPNDVQGNANLTWSGTPAYVAAPDNAEDGKAFDFDGSVYLTAASSVGDYTDNFTAAVWLYLESTDPMRILSKRTVSGAWDMSMSSGRFNIYDGSNTYMSAALSATQTTWLHLALVINGAASGFYINGVLSGSAFNPAIASNTSELYVGRYPLAAQNFFVGKMADIRLYDRALSATELFMLYSGGA